MLFSSSMKMALMEPLFRCYSISSIIISINYCSFKR